MLDSDFLPVEFCLFVSLLTRLFQSSHVSRLFSNFQSNRYEEFKEKTTAFAVCVCLYAKMVFKIHPTIISTLCSLSHSFSMFCQFSLLSFSVWIKFEFMLVGDCYLFRLSQSLFFTERWAFYCAIVRVWSLPATWFQLSAILYVSKFILLFFFYSVLSFYSDYIHL